MRVLYDTNQDQTVQNNIYCSKINATFSFYYSRYKRKPDFYQTWFTVYCIHCTCPTYQRYAPSLHTVATLPWKFIYLIFYSVKVSACQMIKLPKSQVLFSFIKIYGTRIILITNQCVTRCRSDTQVNADSTWITLGMDYHEETWTVSLTKK